MNFLLLAIAILSSSLIGIEVIFVRLLEIIQFAELSSLIVSLSLLGFGYSGVFCYLLKKKLTINSQKFIFLNLILYSLSLVLSFSTTQYLAFNPLEILWNPSQVLYLSFEIIIISLPFFFGSNIILEFLSTKKKISHRIYGSDLIGAGIGSITALLIINFLQPNYYLFALIIFSLIISLLFCFYFKIKKSSYLKLFLFFLPLVFYSLFFEIKISQYKPLAKQKLIPNTQNLTNISAIEGYYSILENEIIPFRFAPGLSLISKSTIPSQIGVFEDGQGFFAIDKITNLFNKNQTKYLLETPQAISYFLKKDKENDIIINNPLGNQSIIRSLVNLKNQVLLVQTNNKQNIFLKQKDTSSFLKPFYENKKVKVIQDKIQHHMLSNKKNKYDIIDLSYLQMSSTSYGSSLHANSILTLESLKLFIDSLKEDGDLLFSFWNSYPPGSIFRLKNILKKLKVQDEKILIVKSINTTSIVVKASNFSPSEKDIIQSFCKKHIFECFGGGLPSTSNKWWNLYGISDNINFSSYPFDFTSTHLEKPYFFSFQKLFSFFTWKSFSSYSKYADLSMGYLLIALFLSILISFFMILSPLILVHKNPIIFFKNNLLFLLYFAFIGLGFMFFEITFIQIFTLILSQKTSSLAIVLCVFLIFSGLGSFRVNNYIKKSDHKKIFLRIILLAVVNALFFLYGYHFLMILPQLLRITLLIIFLSLFCYYLGMPFILGIRALDKDKSLTTWAWGINAFFSVIASILAKISCVYLGITFSLILATIFYLLSFTVFIVKSNVRN
jgi:hypothetical protein